MRKTIATIGMTVAALGMGAGAASASTAADTDATASNETNHIQDESQVGHTKVNGMGSLINVSDVLNDASIANDLLGGGLQADADVDAL